MNQTEKLKSIMLQIHELIDNNVKNEVDNKDNNMLELEHLISNVNNCDSYELQTGYGSKYIKNTFNSLLCIIKKQNQRISQLEKLITNQKNKSNNPFDLV